MAALFLFARQNRLSLVAQSEDLIIPEWLIETQAAKIVIIPYDRAKQVQIFDQ